MTSRSQQIRNWLATQDGPRTPGEIDAGISGGRSRKVAHTIQQMFKDGYLIRHKGETCWRYSLGKPLLRTRKLSADELRRRKNRRERERAHASGRRSWAEFQAELAKRREKREADRAAAAEQRRQKRARQKPVHDSRHRTRAVPAPFCSAPAPQPQAPAETVEQWMARTGKKPQVLPIGAVSQTLGSTNFNNRATTRKAA